MKATVGQMIIGGLLFAAVVWFARMHDFSGVHPSSLPRAGWAGALGVAWVAMTALLARDKRDSVATADAAVATPPDAILVIHASQTGFASDVAVRTAELLPAAVVSSICAT
ncbi:hypothetical protein BJI69_02415 [Luteibacter rhizovicinus DSM 16549]|uniref:Uncharacterized protein n=1 Tax=Luteibacter rhizovicinus DSM 16549 TaxID=1440763 RepID=A0A1L3EP71_9GAMM|nr:hypothetical protein [Luteibacter rhizovicinus]APG02873.1 hypothetical protein BJI69_02415 [Luteibacter rhizovicinus DSM 16549]